MLTTDQRKQDIRTLKEWKELIFPRKSESDFAKNQRDISEMASYMAEKTIDKIKNSKLKD